MDWDKIQTPLELARAMWREPTVCGLPPEQFKALFDRVYQNTSDLESLWQLGGATNDYLRAHPGSVVVPTELAEQLLASDHVDARVIGLKLLLRCNVADDVMVREIIQAMKRNDGYESIGGLYELGDFVHSRLDSGAPTAESLVRSLVATLEPLLDDEDTRASAEHKTDCLKRVL